MSRVLRELGLGPVWRLRDRPAETVAVPEAAPSSAVASPSPAVPVSVQVSAAADAGGDRAGVIATMGWDELRSAVADCRTCVLGATRKQAVLGVGDVQADWLFVGEGPGAEEDERGEPFVGQAGKLLDAMLAAIDLKRGENVYIANTVKCRPPGNRTPEAEETAACWPFLARQIALIRPKLIVALGRPAAQTLLQAEVKIGAARGQVFQHQGIPLIVTYHPAYLLRNLPDKAKAWEDLCFMRKTMAGLA
ncbi:MAG: uracil-DNA glycosylase [Sterolibacteriaceae bacterium MAG5]|nr:uracil-DNA glycosylase [Candidatus Nitricoxidireducens bremensis]